MEPDESWDETTAALYDTPGEGMFADDVLRPTVDHLAELAGTGRVAIPLAERGVPVMGIELSAPMVARPHEKVGADAIPVQLGDMATTRVRGEFSLVYLVFNTIANLLSQDEQVECFRNAACHLGPRGRFVIELWVPQLRQLPPGSPATVFASEPGYVGLDDYDVLHQRVVSHHFRYGRGREATHGISQHRYIWPAELDLMGRLAGFELEARYADWDRSEFTADSRSHVSVYRLAST
jgi:hypothetical protein